MNCKTRSESKSSGPNVCYLFSFSVFHLIPNSATITIANVYAILKCPPQYEMLFIYYPSLQSFDIGTQNSLINFTCEKSETD